MRTRSTLRGPRLAPAALALGAVIALAAFTHVPARAQVFGPPMTLFGSVTDSDGPVGEGITVEAYIGGKVCGRGKTQFTGEGSGRVTVYSADVVSREQTAGCGSDGAEVKVKVGDRFAQQTAKWRPGPQQLDLTYGSATPAAIPTFTPTPTRVPTQGPTTGPGTPTPRGNTPAGGTPATTASVTASTTGTPGPSSTATATPTLRGGLSSSQPGGGGDGGDDGGFPVWGAVVAVLGGLALVGGGVGYLMARGRRHNDDLAL